MKPLHLLADLANRALNFIAPLPVITAMPEPAHADQLTDAEAHIDTWEPPLLAWERELLGDCCVEAQIAEIAAAILRGHDIPAARIYADAIAETITDRFTITTKRGNL